MIRNFHCRYTRIAIHAVHLPKNDFESLLKKESFLCIFRWPEKGRMG